MNLSFVKGILVCFFTSLLLLSQVNAATCVSTGNGNWANAGTWSCGRVPTCGDSVVIQAAHSVTISSQQDLRSCGSNFILVINGTLRFVSGNKLRLACNSRVYIFEGGSLVPGGGGGSSNELEICNNTVWQASDGTFTGPICLPSTLTACATVLPIELISFQSVNCEKGSICFQWRTASELNNYGFYIEASVDGLAFETISFVPSKAIGGNSREILDYQAKCAIQIDRVYFRLKQIDFSGKSNLSDIIYVDQNGLISKGFEIRPNPNSGRFSLLLSNSYNNRKLPYNIKISNAKGVVVFEKEGMKELNEFEIKINLGSNIHKGLYYYHLFFDQKIWTGKIIVLG